MNLVDALEHMEAAAQGNARLEALRQADAACPDLRRLLFLTLSPDVTFGVKKLPKGDDKIVFKFKTEFEFEHVLFELLENLRSRKWTGNEAQEKINKFLTDCNDVQRKWTERSLRQDLRLNIGAKDVNKVLGKNTIYLFEVPLATDYIKVKAKDLKGKWLWEPKLDGGRCVAILPPKGGRVVLKSRTGKEWGNFESVRLALQKIADNRKFIGNQYLDGEVVSYVNDKIDFQSIQKTMLRKDGVEVGDLKFIVFDAAQEAEWREPKLPYIKRLDDALDVCSHGDYLGVSNKIDLVKAKYMDDPTPESLREECAKQVEQGFEGGILRKRDEPVINKRSKSLIKVKLFQDAEAEITGTAELMREGKGDGTLGALICKTGEGVAFEVGSGFSVAERDYLWSIRTELPGKFENYKFFELTRDRVPRLPIHRSLRSADDIGREVNDDSED